NGAGKTTTIRLLLDLIRPTRGTIELLGQDPRRQGVAVRRRVGYLPGDLVLYENLTGGELLHYLSHLRRMTDRSYAGELADRLDLDLTRHIHDLSKGNKQKLGVVQALMHRPELVILDEPTSGLDPLVQQEFHRLVREAAGEGRTVLLSSHVMSEVEHMADRVAILRSGRLAVVERVEVLKSRALRRLELDFAEPVPQEAFVGVPGLRDLDVSGATVRCTLTGAVGPLMRVATRYELLNVTSHEPDLEEIFLGYVTGVEHGAA
ncbi:MAG TPA: ABC transporter ATP-binding protein, partial [Candidatus Eisenbacteria bacterium]|nr:ABC transporter ATP-binding protein [Candidatus Eisenbacteria bacterium]